MVIYRQHNPFSSSGRLRYSSTVHIWGIGGYDSQFSGRVIIDGLDYPHVDHVYANSSIIVDIDGLSDRDNNSGEWQDWM